VPAADVVMPLLLILTIILLLLLGAGGTLGLSLVPRFRPYTRHVALGAVCAATVLILMFRWIGPVEVVLSLWQPSLFFGSALTLQIGGITHPLALALALMTCSAVLVALSRSDDVRPQLVAAQLALLLAALLALWSANVLTLAIAWGIYDLAQTVAYAMAGGSAQTAIRSMVLGNLATLLLWTGGLLSGGRADSELWSLVTLNDVSLVLWASAGMLRLWAHPFHLSTPDDLVVTPSLATPLLLGPVVGWGLWLRLVDINGGAVPGATWVPTAAAVVLALGGLLAWSCKSPRRLLPWVGMGANSAVLLAAGLAGEGASVVVLAGSVAWVLATAMFFLGDGWHRESLWWNIPSLVGLLTLLGLPLTLGFVPAATLLGRLVQEGLLERGVIFWGVVLGNLFLVPSLVRRLLVAPSSSPPERRGMIIARGVGLGMPALLLIGAGIYPPLLLGGGGGSDAVPSLGLLFVMPRLVGWLLWVASFVLGGLLVWQDGFLRSKIEPLLSVIHDVLRLEWLYGAVVGALGRGLSVFESAGEVIGGAGALLWSLLLFLLFLLVRGGS
jgi:formate hydrogenlyase subunit 3/multisubunit Na+/H+ antiporter MnhD subunit